jgi:hypothetical protein
LLILLPQITRSPTQHNPATQHHRPVPSAASQGSRRPPRHRLPVRHRHALYCPHVAVSSISRTSVLHADAPPPCRRAARIEDAAVLHTDVSPHVVALPVLRTPPSSTPMRSPQVAALLVATMPPPCTCRPAPAYCSSKAADSLTRKFAVYNI